MLLIESHTHYRPLWINAGTDGLHVFWYALLFALYFSFLFMLPFFWFGHVSMSILVQY